MRPTLLLIHGFPHDHSLWDVQVRALNGAAEVIAPDLRGFGGAGTVPDIMRMEDYANDLVELLDARDIRKAVICGLSMGGYVALALLAGHRDRVQGLILCNTRATADTPEAAEARKETARDASEKGMAVIARGMLPKMLTERTRREHPQLAEHIEQMMARQAPAAVAAAALGMAQRPDRMSMLPDIQVPTLIITGSEDALMPLPTSQAMADAIPGSKLVVIPGAAHLSNVEAPERFNDEVRRFITALGEEG